MKYVINAALPSVEEADEEEDADRPPVNKHTPDAWMTVEEARSICLEAVKVTELHVTESQSIWMTYLNFEMRVLDVCTVERLFIWKKKKKATTHERFIDHAKIVRADRAHPICISHETNQTAFRYS